MSSNDRKEPSESVIEAIMKNDVARLKQLRDAGEDFTCRDENGSTLLHLAILTKPERELCKSGREFDRTHLTRAEVFDYLLTLNEINKNAKSENQNTALMEIFKYLPDSADWAIELIKSGCDIHQWFDNRSSALHCAITNDWYEVAELLIEKGCEIDDKQPFELETPLRLACKRGRLDLIWMLLFYGADPNKGHCFDLVFQGFVRREVRDIFKSLVGYEKVFYLLPFISAMKDSPEHFYELCDASDSIQYGAKELECLAYWLSSLRPELFKIFVQKYDYVIHDMFEAFSHDWRDTFAQSKKELRIFATNIFTLLESHLAGCIVNFCNKSYWYTSKPRMFYFVHWFLEHDDELDLATQIILSLLSYGVEVPAELMIRIYYKFRYCSLFKMLLYMDISEIDTEYWEVVPRIFFDIRLTPQKLIQSIEYSYINVRRYLNLIFDYFALPKLVKCCVDESLKYANQMKQQDRFEWYIIERVKSLPDVPKLVELARNEAREFIIHKYKIQSCGQFYTIIDWLPIAKIHKEILTYQKKLYE